MFGILSKIRNLFIKKDDQRDDIYSVSERSIYRYFDGQRQIDADPLVLWKKLMEVGPELSIDLKTMQLPIPAAPSAQDQAIKKIRTVFEIKSLAEGGLTELETLHLLDHFMVFVLRVKKNSRDLLTSSQNAEASPVSTEANLPIPPSSESGSTANEPSTEQQEQLPTEQPSLSAQ